MSRICVFGDSIVWGASDPTAKGWVGRMFETGYERLDLSDISFGTYTAVYNCGISGDKLIDVLSRFDLEARAREPRVIVLAAGINDVPHNDYPGTPLDELRDRYDELIHKAKGHALEVLTVTPTNVDESRKEHNYRNGDIEKVVEIVENSSEAAGVQSVNVFGLMTNEDLHPDGLHPGSEGHQKLYDRIAPVVFGLSSLANP